MQNENVILCNLRAVEDLGEISSMIVELAEQMTRRRDMPVVATIAARRIEVMARVITDSAELMAVHGAQTDVAVVVDRGAV